MYHERNKFNIKDKVVFFIKDHKPEVPIHALINEWDMAESGLKFSRKSVELCMFREVTIP